MSTEQLKSRGKLELLTGLLGIESLRNHQRMSAANQEAENRWVRKRVWGSDSEVEADDMGHGQTILGDVTNPTPIVIDRQQNQMATLLAAVALGAGIPGAGVAGFLFSKPHKPETPAVQPQDSETIRLGLGKIADHLGLE